MGKKSPLHTNKNRFLARRRASKLFRFNPPAAVSPVAYPIVSIVV